MSKLLKADFPVEGKLVELPSHNYIHRATSDNTRKAYQTDIRHFMAWGGLLPTTPDVVIRYLEAHAETLNSRTLTRRLTALKNWHIYQGFTDPTGYALVRKTLTGIKNVHGKPKDKAPAMTLETLITLCDHLQGRGGLVDLRYLKHGYEIFGILDDCPLGHKRYYLKKVL